MLQIQNTFFQLTQISRVGVSLLAPMVVMGEVKWRIVVLTAATFAAMC